MDKHASVHASSAPAAQVTHAPHASHAEGHAHVIPLKVYFGVWGALMVGTVLTVAAAFVDLGPVNVPLMLLIATTKATLVALFFMHLYYDEKFNLVVLLGGVFFVLLFFIGTLQDVLTRGAVDPIERYPIAAEMDRLGSGKQPILREEAGEHGAATASGTAAHPQHQAGENAPVTATPVPEGLGGNQESAAPGEVPPSPPADKSGATPAGTPGPHH